ncbi:hypothetical protein EZV62_003899 [Acer yangbiense]|uniref:Uncharacterized protein n=1 Tax=Acer yangbiense TaxID=1000413 RepID=A0A5C7IJ80_9ROSI|nr:hypothetical protein EZV62_003899 [Acer yangbiense]
MMHSQLSRSKQKWRRLFSGLFHSPQIQPKHIKVLAGLENGQTVVMSLARRSIMHTNTVEDVKFFCMVKI